MSGGLSWSSVSVVPFSLLLLSWPPRRLIQPKRSQSTLTFAVLPLSHSFSLKGCILWYLKFGEKNENVWHLTLQSIFIDFSEWFSVINTILLSRHHAEKVKATTEAVKKALLSCKTAQTSAEKAIMAAKADIMDTETRLAQVSAWQRNAGYLQESGRWSSCHKYHWVFPYFLGKLSLSTLCFCVCLLLKLPKGYMYDLCRVNILFT